jgi:ubiquinone/menaquinone biosynthesis C-methylase UbiE
MKLFHSVRIPLHEKQFIDAAAAQLYDGHARRFMMPIYHCLTAKAAGANFPGNRVLDIGTGSGILAIKLAKAHPDWHVTGIDISEEMLKIGRGNASRLGLAEKIDFWNYTGEALPFEDNYFGLVVSNASLHLWTDPLKVFKEIARVTARQGCCLIWDNLRLSTFNPLLNLVGWGMGMNKAQRRLWLQAVESAYTSTEARELLKLSSLKDAKVTTNPILAELCLRWVKG